MTIEIRLEHIQCNLSCRYCYEQPLRESGNDHSKIDISAIKSSISKLYNVENEVVISGGEPLLARYEELKDIIEFASEYCEKINLQTNGALLEDKHLELFKKNKVTVGISIDGPGELNDFRWAGSIDKTRAATRRTMENLKKIKPNNISGGVIVTVHQKNAGNKERLEKLKDFIVWLKEEAEMTGGNLHMLQRPSVRKGRSMALGGEKNAEVFLELAKFIEKKTELSWKPFSDLKKLIRGKDERVSCLWTKCDPWNTRTLRGIESDGSITCCSRGEKSGFTPLRSFERSFERYISLYNTPQSQGGCKNCRFFVICTGFCPGSGQSGDWRNKTYHCRTIKSLLKFYEQKVVEEGHTPLSHKPELNLLENWILNKLRLNEQPVLHRGLEEI